MRPSRSGVRRTQKTEENKKEAIKKRDGKLLQYVNNGYETMHLFMGYDGSREKKVCDSFFLLLVANCFLSPDRGLR